MLVCLQPGPIPLGAVTTAKIKNERSNKGRNERRKKEGEERKEMGRKEAY